MESLLIKGRQKQTNNRALALLTEKPSFDGKRGFFNKQKAICFGSFFGYVFHGTAALRFFDLG